MVTFRRIVVVAALVASGSLAYALDTNDIVNLSKAKTGDEVIIAQIKVTKARFTLTADEIVRLKKEGVSDAVLKAMIETVKPAPKKEAAVETRPAEAPENQVTKAEASGNEQRAVEPRNELPVRIWPGPAGSDQRGYVQPTPPPAPAQVVAPEPPATAPEVIYTEPAPQQVIYYTAPPPEEVYYVPAYPPYWGYYGYPRGGCHYYGPGIHGHVDFRGGRGHWRVGVR